MTPEVKRELRPSIVDFVVSGERGDGFPSDRMTTRQSFEQR